MRFELGSESRRVRRSAGLSYGVNWSTLDTVAARLSLPNHFKANQTWQAICPLQYRHVACCGIHVVMLLCGRTVLSGRLAWVTVGTKSCDVPIPTQLTTTTPRTDDDTTATATTTCAYEADSSIICKDIIVNAEAQACRLRTLPSANVRES